MTAAPVSWAALPVVLLLPSIALSYTCDTDSTRVWPTDGALAPNGFVLVEGEGTWRRPVEHFPIYRLTFVGEKESVRAVATLISEPGALRAQVAVRATKPLTVGAKYRLKMETSASCVEKPRSAFLHKPRSSSEPAPLEWTVRAQTSEQSSKLVMKSVQISGCSKPPCEWRRLEVGIERIAVVGEFAALLKVTDSQETARALAVISEAGEIAVVENRCNKGVFFDARGKICVTGRLMMRSGELGPESAEQCFAAE